MIKGLKYSKYCILISQIVKLYLNLLILKHYFLSAKMSVVFNYWISLASPKLKLHSEIKLDTWELI